MSSKCRFPGCQWSGGVDDIFDHCETFHSKGIREIGEDNKVEFTFEDIFIEAFLLNGSQGLYWFLLDPEEQVDCVRRGLFAIGDTEQIEYTLKLGSINVDFRFDIVQKYAKPENSNEYELVWPFEFLQSLDDIFKSKKMVLYFGECPHEEYTGTYEDVDWNDSEEEEYNTWCLEKFTCPVCFEYIRKDAKFCENAHFICSDCLNKMIERNQIKCPQCRGSYPYDCTDPEIENILRCVRFPPEEE